MNYYDKNFNEELNRILDQLWNSSNGNSARRITIQTEKKYIDYLMAKQIIKVLESGSTTRSYNIQLESNGYLIFEKYNGWFNYKKKVIDRTNKVEHAKSLAALYWWVPIIISLIALAISILAVINENNK
jgi:hypothetical protein